MEKFTLILDVKKGAKGVFYIDCKEIFTAIERAQEIIKCARNKYTGSYSIKDVNGEEVAKATSLA